MCTSNFKIFSLLLFLLISNITIAQLPNYKSVASITWYDFKNSFNEANGYILDQGENYLSLNNESRGEKTIYNKNTNGNYIYSNGNTKIELKTFEEDYIGGGKTVRNTWSEDYYNVGFVKISPDDITKSNKLINEYQLKYRQSFSVKNIPSYGERAGLFYDRDHYLQEFNNEENTHIARTYKLNVNGEIFYEDYRVIYEREKKRLYSGKKYYVDYQLMNNSLDYLLIDVDIISRGTLDYNRNCFVKEYVGLILPPNTYFKGDKTLSEINASEDDFRFVIKNIKKIDKVLWLDIIKMGGNGYNFDILHLEKLLKNSDLRFLEKDINRYYFAAIQQLYLPQIKTFVELETGFHKDFPSNVTFKVKNTSDKKLKVRYKLSNNEYKVENIILEANSEELLKSVFHKIDKHYIKIEIIDVLFAK